MYKIFRCQQMGVLQDQEWKIPGESWNSINIFYSVTTPLHSSYVALSNLFQAILARDVYLYSLRLPLYPSLWCRF